jgi:hypothetical protein
VENGWGFLENKKRLLGAFRKEGLIRNSEE